LRKAAKKALTKPSIPKYDPREAPLFDINAIRKMLPHRPPFLLVDKILTRDETTIVGVKNVTMNEPFFKGHFPEEPVMPGVLIIEAMAQCGGLLVLGSVPDPEHYSTYFLKIDKVKFRDKVVPGDTLIFKLTLIEPIRRGIVVMSAQAFVGENLVAEGELTAQVVRNK
jgi:UDP-3-O-[3-hydroxymyristoyl] N-acetylglucosamine deacetylase/3-hydroxyacyl-[acyl-carrier-protein] dehydratase